MNKVNLIKTDMDSDSDDVIDNSIVFENSYIKTPGKNKTYLPETDESSDYNEEEEVKDVSFSLKDHKKNKKVKEKQSSSLYMDTHNISSSDTDSDIRSGSRKQTKKANSYDENEYSPELVPKLRYSRIGVRTPFSARKPRKRMVLDSDTDNSILLEHVNQRKLTCLKDTPLKISGKENQMNVSNVMISDSDDAKGDSKYNESRRKQKNLSESDNDSIIEESDTEDDVKNDSKDNESSRKQKKLSESDNDSIIEESDTQHDVEDHSKDIESNEEQNNPSDSDNDSIIEESDTQDDSKDIGSNEEQKNPSDSDNDSITEGSDTQDDVKDDSKHNKSSRKQKNLSESDIDLIIEENETQDYLENNEKDNTSDESVEPDEDEMVISRATRMSILGYAPKGESDGSDVFQSDESNSKSRSSINTTVDRINISTEPSNLSNVDFKTTIKTEDTVKDNYRISSHLKDSDGSKDNINQDNNRLLSEKVLSNLKSLDKNKTVTKNSVFNVEDDSDDIAIVDSGSEVIEISSGEDTNAKKSPNIKKSPGMKATSSSGKTPQSSRSKDKSPSKYQQLLPPASYPNQVVYVKKHVKFNELQKLEQLTQEMDIAKVLLETMDTSTLPDNGRNLLKRLEDLEREIRAQGDKVANMVIEPEVPTADDIANDGFDSGLNWDDIQKASNEVQPRMFGKKAMSTHMAEHRLILDRLGSLHASLDSRPGETELAPAPKRLVARLQPHQRHALAWLVWRETQKPRGGILADDMGLGKTITMISLILHDLENKNDGSDDDSDGSDSNNASSGGTLVVCPASLMWQWEGEVKQHCEAHALSYCLHHGAARSRHPHRLAAHNLVLTTYNLLQRDHEKRGVLMRVRWRRVILDEAHVVRNHKSATSAAVCAVDAPRRWCLTGTPVQNQQLDMFALLKFLRCTPFDDVQMWKKWIDKKSVGAQERLAVLMRCVMLRRTKAQLQQRGQLQELPARTQHDCPVTLDKAEMDVYQKVLVLSKTLFAQFLHQRAEKQADSEGLRAASKDSAYAEMHKRMMALKGVKPVKSHEILVLLLRLRQVCCHCGLISSMLNSEDSGLVDEDQGGKDLLDELKNLTLQDGGSKRKGKDEDDKDEEDETGDSPTAAEAIRSLLSYSNPVFQLSRQSSKIRAVMDCLNKHVLPHKDEKAVVVSQWTSMLGLVGGALDAAKVRYVTLSGSVPVPSRRPLVQAINDRRSDVRVMLLSLMAGGVGLNLCGANHLLVLDPHWNPQLEHQAQDRVYRMGQTKPVHIYKFTCVDTVEHTIKKLQEAKLSLADNVLTGAKNTNQSKLSIEDLKELFSMHSE